MENISVNYSKNLIENPEFEKFSIKLQSLLSKIEEKQLKTREKTRNIEFSMLSIFNNLSDLKFEINHHNFIRKNSSECIEKIHYYINSMETLKICKEVDRIPFGPDTIDKYIKNARIIDSYIKYFDENAPTFPEKKSWEYLQKRANDIFIGYINNFLEQEVESNIIYITDLANSWVIHGLIPYQDDFIKRRTDNLNDEVLNKIIPFMHEKGIYIENDQQFTNKKKSFYENVISNCHKMNSNSQTDDKKSGFSVGSTGEKRKNLKKTKCSRFIENIFQSNSLEIPNEQIPDDFTIISKIYAISLLILKMDTCSVQKVYQENTRGSINSSLLKNFWSLIFKIIENTYTILNKSILFNPLNECLNVINMILPILTFFYETQEQALELSRSGNNEMDMFILNFTKPLENLLFEAFRSLEDQLKEKSDNDNTKNNEHGIDEKIITIKKFISKLHSYINEVRYACAKNKISLEFSKLEDHHISYLYAISEPLIAKYIKSPLSLMKNEPSPRKEIYTLNQCRYILECFENVEFISMVSPNKINLYKTRLDKIIESPRSEYLKYWEKGIKPLNVIYAKLETSISKFKSGIFELKTKDKTSVKSAFSDFKDFMKQAAENHNNIKFYDIADTIYFKQNINEMVINQYASYCETFEFISSSKNPKEHIKIQIEDVQAIIDIILTI